MTGMIDSFKKYHRQLLNFSKKDRNTILFLGILILISITANIIVNKTNPKSKYSYAEYIDIIRELEGGKGDFNKNSKSLFAFDPNNVSPEMLDSLNLPVFVKKNLLNYIKAGGRFTTAKDIRKIYGMNDSIYQAIEKYIQIEEIKNSVASIMLDENKSRVPVDPNRADFNQLTEIGFTGFQAGNIIQYRKKDGIFKTKTDLLKIYGIDSVFFKTIEPFIKFETIEELPLTNNNKVILNIELNSADSASLTKLNGIGSVYANRILKYRSLLGGFYSTSQLREVYNFPEETYRDIENLISVDTLLIKKIRVNFAEYAELIRHPYLNKNHVEAILSFRGKKGPFQNNDELKINGLIDNETFYRVSPYITCR